MLHGVKLIIKLFIQLRVSLGSEARLCFVALRLRTVVVKTDKVGTDYREEELRGWQH
jgi:predicted HTH domain antitoxin